MTQQSIFLAPALLVCALVCGLTAPARAEGVNLVGAWSGQSPGQGGMQLHTISFGADGSFVSVVKLPNGTMERIWGGYSASPTSPTRIVITSQRRGWLPRRMCVQVEGFNPKCDAYDPPTQPSVVLDFTSPSSFRINGMTMSRDSSPVLLQQVVPEQLMLHAPAPVRPNIRQPVAPQGRRYQTPHDPGRPGGDDLQQERICAVNNGQTIVQPDGHKICFH